MQSKYDEFEERDTVVIDVAQEDTDLASHGKFLVNFSPGPRFDIVADIDRKKTKKYDRTTAYLIDKEGMVRQIFPMLIHERASWGGILHEIDRMNGGE